MGIAFLGEVGTDDGVGDGVTVPCSIAFTEDLKAGTLVVFGLTWTGFGSNASATQPFSMTGPSGETLLGMYVVGGGAGGKVTGSNTVAVCKLTEDISAGEEIVWVFRNPLSPFQLRSAEWAAVLLAFSGSWGEPTVFDPNPQAVYEAPLVTLNTHRAMVGENTHSGRDIDIGRDTAAGTNVDVHPGTYRNRALLVAALSHIGSPSDVGSLPAGWVIAGQASRSGVTNTATVEGGTRTIDLAYRLAEGPGLFPIDTSPFYAGADRYHTHQALSLVEYFAPLPGISPGLLEAVGTPGHVIIGPSGESL